MSTFPIETSKMEMNKYNLTQAKAEAERVITHQDLPS
jgi:hypothetical protein